jgi:polysaccharide pyruvyl transferase CsaB
VRIGISGSYGGLNLGDEAILSTIVAELRRRGAGDELVIFSRQPEHTRRLYPAARVVAVREIDVVTARHEVARLDVLLLGGGGVLFDTEVPLFLREILIAQALGIPTMAVAVGAGPLNHPDERDMVARALSAMTSVSVRSTESCRLLRECGVTRDVAVVADPVWLLPAYSPSEPFPLETLGLPAHRPIVAVAAREPGPAAPLLNGPDYHGYLAAGVRHAVERYGAHVVFIAMEECDVQHSRRVLSKAGVPASCTVLERFGDPQDVFRLLRHARIAFGLRFHFLLLAVSGGVPVVVPPLVEKLSGLADELALPAAYRPDRTAASLTASLDAAWRGGAWDASAAVNGRAAQARAGLNLMTSELVAAVESAAGRSPGMVGAGARLR